MNAIEQQIERVYRACTALAESVRRGREATDTGLVKLANSMDWLGSKVSEAKASRAGGEFFARGAFGFLKVTDTWFDDLGAESTAELRESMDELLAAVGLVRAPATDEMREKLEGGLLDTLRKEHLATVLAQGEVPVDNAFTLRIRAVSEEEDGRVRAALDGLRKIEDGGDGGGPFKVGPVFVVGMKPFLVYVTDAVDAAARTSEHRLAHTLAAGVIMAVRESFAGQTVEAMNGEEAVPAVKALEAAYDGLAVGDRVNLREQLQEYYRVVRAQPGRGATVNRLHRLADLCRSDLEKIHGESWAASPAGSEVEPLRRAIVAANDRAAARALGRLHRAAWISPPPDDAGAEASRQHLLELTARALEEIFGCVVVDAEKAAKYWGQPYFQPEFDVEYAEAARPGLARDAFVDLRAPGLRIRDGDFLVRPKVLVSRGEESEVHRFLKDLGAEILARPDDRKRLEAAIDAGAAAAFEIGGDRAAQRRLVFGVFANDYASLSETTRVWLRRTVRERFAAELLVPPVGEVVRGVAPGSDDPPGLEIEWARGESDEETGTVLGLRRPGLRPETEPPAEGDEVVPARVTLATGRATIHPFLVRLAGLELPADGPARPIVDGILAGTIRGRSETAITPESLDAVAGRAMALHKEAMRGEDGVPGLESDEIAGFLEDLGYERFPTERELLTTADLDGETDAYRFAFEFHESLGAGRVVKVLEAGWRRDGEVVRKAHVLLSRGVDPDLKRICDAALEVADRLGDAGGEAGRRIRSIYAEEVVPRLERPVVLEGRDRGAIGEELRPAAESLLDPLETLREAAEDGSPEAATLDRVLDEDLGRVLAAGGIEVRPRRGTEVAADSPDLDVVREYADDVPEGRVVRVRRRALSRRGSEGERLAVRRGAVVVSAGPAPAFLRRIRDLVAATGDLEVPGVRELARSALAPGFADRLDEPAVREELALAAGRAIDGVDAAAERLREKLPRREEELAAVTGGLVADLASLGIEIRPERPDQVLADPAFGERFAVEPDTFEYAADGPAATPGRVLAVRRRSVAVDGAVKVTGVVRVGGGRPDPLVAHCSAVGRLVPELAAEAEDAARAIRAARDVETRRAIEGREPDAGAETKKADAALGLVRRLQGRAGPDADGFREVWNAARAILADVAARFSVRVLPDRGDDGASLREAMGESDRFESAFSETPRGDLIVRKYGWRGPGRTEGFHVVESLGPKPSFLRDLEALPGFTPIAGGAAPSDLAPWESEVAAVLAEFRRADLDPGDTEGSVLPAFGRIFDVLVGASVDARVLEAFLGLLQDRFGVEAFPRPGARFSPRADCDAERTGVSIVYGRDHGDLIVARVDRLGLRRAGEILRPARFAVNRTSRSKSAEILSDRVLPILDHLAGALPGEGARGAGRLRAEAMEHLLLPDAERDSDEGRQDAVRIALQLRLAVPPEEPLPTPAGDRPAREVVKSLLDDLGAACGFDLTRLAKPLYSRVLGIAGEVRGLIEELGAGGETERRLAEAFGKGLVRDLEGYLHAYEQGVLSERKELTEADECEYLIQVLNALYAALDAAMLDPGMTEALAERLRSGFRRMIQGLQSEVAREYKLIAVPLTGRALGDRQIAESPLPLPAAERKPWLDDVNVVRPCLRHAETQDVRQRGIVRVFE